MLGIIGGFIAPVFKPMGFATWQAAVSLLTGFVAKEAVVSSLCLFYGISWDKLGNKLDRYPPLTHQQHPSVFML